MLEFNINIEPIACLEDAVKDEIITQQTYERVKVARSFIENKYRIKVLEESTKKKEWEIINRKIEELPISPDEAESIKNEINRKESEVLRLNRNKIQVERFEPLTIIGKGAFGEVRICRDKETGELVAIKKLKKEDMHKKNQILHIRSEKEVLSMSRNPWVVDLKFSFQDDIYLYLVMEYLPGGDLMNLLIARDILTEDESRFYAAELILAIEAVHKLNTIHRDIKPDNVLIGKDGHIKLSDFGLCKRMNNHLYSGGSSLSFNNFTRSKNSKALFDMAKRNKKRRIVAFSTVGTPDYIAPEVYEQKGYGPEIDWWSLGVILFEMLIGYPPFFSENSGDTCQKILQWKTNGVIPTDTKISPDSIDIIKQLMTGVDKRLGYHGSDEIKKHPFFKSIDWKNIRNSPAPFIPDLNSELDTKYFDSFTEDEPFYPNIEDHDLRFSNDVCFLDFGYKRELDNPNRMMTNALELIETYKLKYPTKQEVKKTKIEKTVNLSRLDTKSSDTIMNTNNTQNNIHSLTDEGDIQKFKSTTEVLSRKKKENAASDFLIKNHTKDFFEKINTKNDKLKNNPASFKITNIKENKKPLKELTRELTRPELTRPNTNTNQKNINTINNPNNTNNINNRPITNLSKEKNNTGSISSKNSNKNFNKLLIDTNYKNKIKTPSPGSLKLRGIPSITPKSTSHCNLLKNYDDSKESSSYLKTVINDEDNNNNIILPQNKFNKIPNFPNSKVAKLSSDKIKIHNDINDSESNNSHSNTNSNINNFNYNPKNSNNNNNNNNNSNSNSNSSYSNLNNLLLTDSRQQNLLDLYMTNYEILLTEPNIKRESSKPKIMKQNTSSLLKTKITPATTTNSVKNTDKKLINFGNGTRTGPLTKLPEKGHEISLSTKNFDKANSKSNEKVIIKVPTTIKNNTIELRKTKTNANLQSKLFTDKNAMNKQSVKLLR